MKIATWNVERLKHSSHLEKIIEQCEIIDADILILTETDEAVMPDYENHLSSAKFHDAGNGIMYKPTENRVSIFTKYKIIKMHETFDKHTALCVEVETPYGNLIVYGTIIGIYGNRHKNFDDDLAKQLNDFDRLSKLGNLCIAGDFNQSFCDNYYYTEKGRNDILNNFRKNNINILTSNATSCIDHIAISNSFACDFDFVITEWNEDKLLSDHKGIAITTT